MFILKIVNVSRDDIITQNSSPLPVRPEQKYKASGTFVGKKGKQYSAYFSVIIHDSNKKEILRRIRWLNDFSGYKKKYEIIFSAPHNSKVAILGYRINHETPIQSDLTIHLPDKDSIMLEEVSNNLKEQFDILWTW